MAQRRMIALSVYRQTKFLMLSFAAQALYAHLVVNADDDGVVQAFPIIRMVGAKEEDLRELIDKGYVLEVNDDFLVFITDWLKQNRVPPNKYHEGAFTEEMKKAGFIRIDRGYLPPGSEVQADFRQDSDNFQAQSSLVQSSLVQVSSGQVNSDQVIEGGVGGTPQAGQQRRVYGKFKNVFLSGEEYTMISRVIDNVEKAINDLSEHKKNTGECFDSDYDALRKIRRGDLVIQK